ncbi:DUF3575 domain-containing protein [Dyadobacter bucti]|jgi:hypothetical protein|uniref:DUF3575 domain-containing protein n=1 Tax=Dyadobacter bucti TaxID=2572203 RepID=UPI0011083309|nr:DUF3575 domain-containing protein [Dyadobacter bucti]
MRKVSGLVVTLLFFISPCFAQINARSAPGHVIVKFSPLTLFDIDNTVQFGVEIPLGHEKLTLQQDLGYGHSSFSIWYSGYDYRPDKEIFKTRTQLRYYYFGKKWARGYVGPEFMFKKVIYRENKFVGMDCVNGTCGYFENKDIKSARSVGAAHVKAGWQFYFSNRMTLDVFTGFGLRQYRVRSLSDGVDDFNFSGSGYFWENNRPGSIETFPSLAMGFNIGIMLGKFED